MDDRDRELRKLRRENRILKLENYELRVFLAELIRKGQQPPAFENVTVIIEPTKQQMAQRH
jgi:regulator of replication initiation timing